MSLAVVFNCYTKEIKEAKLSNNSDDISEHHDLKLGGIRIVKDRESLTGLGFVKNTVEGLKFFFLEDGDSPFALKSGFGHADKCKKEINVD
jgi:hypothetical protein